jgi:hypothetical protein
MELKRRIFLERETNILNNKDIQLINVDPHQKSVGTTQG